MELLRDSDLERVRVCCEPLVVADSLSVTLQDGLQEGLLVIAIVGIDAESLIDILLEPDSDLVLVSEPEALPLTLKLIEFDSLTELEPEFDTLLEPDSLTEGVRVSIGLSLGELLGVILREILGEILGVILREILGVLLGEILREILGEILREILGVLLGELLGEILREILGEIVRVLLGELLLCVSL